MAPPAVLDPELAQTLPSHAIDQTIVNAGTHCAPGGDCSSFAQNLQKNRGISVPRTAIEQYHASQRVGIDDLQPGDHVFFDNKSRSEYNTKGKGVGNGQYVNHVGVYVGNGQFIADDGRHKGDPRTIRDLRSYIQNNGYAFMGGGRFGGATLDPELASGLDPELAATLPQHVKPSQHQTVSGPAVNLAGSTPLSQQLFGIETVPAPKPKSAKSSGRPLTVPFGLADPDYQDHTMIKGGGMKPGKAQPSGPRTDTIAQLDAEHRNDPRWPRDRQKVIAEMTRLAMTPRYKEGDLIGTTASDSTPPTDAEKQKALLEGARMGHQGTGPNPGQKVYATGTQQARGYDVQTANEAAKKFGFAPIAESAHTKAARLTSAYDEMDAAKAAKFKSNVAKVFSSAGAAVGSALGDPTGVMHHIDPNPDHDYAGMFGRAIGGMADPLAQADFVTGLADHPLETASDLVESINKIWGLSYDKHAVTPEERINGIVALVGTSLAATHGIHKGLDLASGKSADLPINPSIMAKVKTVVEAARLGKWSKTLDPVVSELIHDGVPADKLAAGLGTQGPQIVAEATKPPANTPAKSRSKGKVAKTKHDPLYMGSTLSTDEIGVGVDGQKPRLFFLTKDPAIAENYAHAGGGMRTQKTNPYLVDPETNAVYERHDDTWKHIGYSNEANTRIVKRESSLPDVTHDEVMSHDQGMNGNDRFVGMKPDAQLHTAEGGGNFLDMDTPEAREILKKVAPGLLQNEGLPSEAFSWSNTKYANFPDAGNQWAKMWTKAIGHLKELGYDGITYYDDVSGFSSENARRTYAVFDEPKWTKSERLSQEPAIASTTKAGGEGSATESARQTIRTTLDSGDPVVTDHIAEQHGITPDEVEAMRKEEAAGGPKVKLSERLKATADAIAADIKASSSKSKKGGGTNIPAKLAEFAIRALSGAVKFGEWSGAMIGRFGEGIKPHLENAWRYAQDTADAWHDFYSENLAKTSRLAPRAAQAFKEFAGADGQAHSIWSGGRTLVDGGVGEDGYFDKTFYPTLAQDNLNGARLQAPKAAAEVAGWGDNFADNWKGSEASKVVHHAGGGEAVEEALADGHVDEARQAALDTLADLQDKTRTDNNYLTEDEFKANRADPRYKRALEIYKDNVENFMAENHQRWGGVFTNSLGEDKTYTPLVRKSGPRASIDQGASVTEGRNVGNIMRTGQGDYTVEPGEVRDQIIQRTRGSAKANLVRVLNESGLIRASTPEDLQYKSNASAVASRNKTRPGEGGAVRAGTMNVNGTDYNTKLILNGNGVPKLIVKEGGKTVYVAGKSVSMPHWLYDEVGRYMERGAHPYDTTSFGTPFYNTLNKAKIIGVTEPIAHGFNIFGAATSVQPTVGKSLLGRAANFMPFGKVISTLVDRARIDVNAPEFHTDMIDLARRGLLPTRTGPMLGPQEYAPGGVKNFLAGKTKPIGPKKWIFDPRSGLDIRNRVAMLRDGKARMQSLGIDFDSPKGAQQLYDYVNAGSGGSYTWQLMSELERRWKGSGFSPFLTAAKTKAIGGIKGATGTTALAEAGGGLKAIPPRVAQIITGGAVGYFGAWYFANKMLGNDPSKQKLGEIPVPKDVPLIGGMTLNLNPLYAYTAAGFTDTGIKAAADSYREGKTPKDIWAAMTAAWGNTALKPVSGSPTADFAARALAGKAIYLEPDWNFLQVGPDKAPSFANAENAIASAIPFGSVVEGAGVVPEAKWLEKRTANMTPMEKLATGLTRVFAPGMVGPPSSGIDGSAKLKALQDRETAWKKGQGPPLSHDESVDLHNLRDAHSDANPKGPNSKLPESEADNLDKDAGRTRSGSKRKVNSTTSSMATPRYKWENGDMIRV